MIKIARNACSQWIAFKTILMDQSSSLYTNERRRSNCFVVVDDECPSPGSLLHLAYWDFMWFCINPSFRVRAVDTHSNPLL